MDGILIIDKPAGITSHDVVSRVRRVLKTKRVGHTGTLDPFATGVMVILVGQATRLAQFLDKDEKEYEALVRFGFETDTGDKTGSPMSQVPSPTKVGVEDVQVALNDFRGEIKQMPPMYSAKKVAGKKLYEHARKGEIIDRKSIAVNIYKLDIINDSVTESLEPGTWDLGLKVRCSAGTYIRTLAEDIGRKLDIGAHLAELRRTRAGKFDISQSLSLGELEKLEDPAGRLRPMQEAVSHLPALNLSEERIAKTKNGLSTRVSNAEFKNGQPIQMLDDHENLIAIGHYDKSKNMVQPKVVLV